MSIVTALDRDSWIKQALCAGHPERGAWFPEEGESSARAKAVCRACPVRSECLAFAVKTGQRDGIWGGMTPHERRRLVKQHRMGLTEAN